MELILVIVILVAVVGGGAIAFIPGTDHHETD